MGVFFREVADAVSEEVEEIVLDSEVALLCCPFVCYM